MFVTCVNASSCLSMRLGWAPVRAHVPYPLAVWSPSGILQPCCWNSDDCGYGTEGSCQCRELHDGSTVVPPWKEGSQKVFNLLQTQTHI